MIRNGEGDGVRLPGVQLWRAVWRLCCTAILLWGAWASVGGDWFAGAPGLLRIVFGVLLGVMAVGVLGQAFSALKRYRARTAGPDLERTDGLR